MWAPVWLEVCHDDVALLSGLQAVKLTSTKTQLPYEYYSLPFCQPEEGIIYKTENLGTAMSPSLVMCVCISLVMCVCISLVMCVCISLVMCVCISLVMCVCISLVMCVCISWVRLESWSCFVCYICLMPAVSRELPAGTEVRWGGGGGGGGGGIPDATLSPPEWFLH